MSSHDTILQTIAEALLMDYSSVYYINAVTNEYRCYTIDPQTHKLYLEHQGDDYADASPCDIEQMVYEEDRHLFQKFLSADAPQNTSGNGEQNIEFRMMIDGKPVYHTLRMIRSVSETSDCYIFGILNIDKEVKRRQSAAVIEQECAIYNQITSSLASHYDSLFYINMKTGDYLKLTPENLYSNLDIREPEHDYFTKYREHVRKYVHPDDCERVLTSHTRENILPHLESSGHFSMTYRVIVDGKIIHYRQREMWANDHKHIITCMENIDAEVTVEEALKKGVTYGQIAESLALHYDVLYYVDMESSNYAEYHNDGIYGTLELQEEGKNFFADAERNAALLVHPLDRARITEFLSKDYIIHTLQERKQFSADYNLVVDGKNQCTRMTIMRTSDRTHIIVGVENIEEEARREREQIRALNEANELARRDELTGIKNKNAFEELERAVQTNIRNGTNYLPFAIVVCDINNLKQINDLHGHKAGDGYICAACRMICSIFTHCPVFRIGGDEFAVFMRSSDYDDRETLLKKLRNQSLENLMSDGKPVVAAGLAVYDPKKDISFAQVFERADNQMYQDKQRLKQVGIQELLEKRFTIDEPIPAARKRIVDEMFQAFSMTAEGAYVFFCDLHYSYSRWSRTAVTLFGLPSEYMYHAGSAWEEHIHPDDLESCRISINTILAGISNSTDVQFRARKADGIYEVCTCRGIMLRDENGEPVYFAGVIRCLGMQDRIDSLTGLRNLYGFFEDLQTNIRSSTKAMICLIGVGKFSEINEVYGYQFGNHVLQNFSRYLREQMGDDSLVYRLDGTKFAVLSQMSGVEIHERYDELRQYCRERLTVDNKHVILDLNAGLLAVDHFDIDYETVYACLNFAHGESKIRRQGDLVEFGNDLNNDNKHRIEKLHAIRASITQQFYGFYLLYQPVVDAHTEELIGAEALLRWKSDEYGMVPPDHFIPVLEKDSLFCDLGQWVIRTAIRAGKAIIRKYPNFVINVNLSYTQLEKPDFVDMVLALLREEDLPPEHLCLEITERCRLLDMDLLKNVIVNLRGQGIRIALDDFGTGFSSIGLVKNLPFDTIKIDRSFVLRIEEDEKERQLMQAFVGAASTYGAKVCVEGIETEGMRDILQKYQIQSFQGYYYAKPLVLSDLLDWNPQKK